MLNFSSEDKILFAKAQDCYKMAQKKGFPVFTDFLNPVTAEAFLCSFKNEARVFGGYDEAERKIIGFSLDVDKLTDDIFPIVPLMISFNEKFSKPPGHRDYLGSILGLGLERTKIGDIRLTPSGAVVFVKKEIAEYITVNMEQVGNVKVKVTAAQHDSLLNLPESGTTKRINVASLRLDAVVSAAFTVSRGKAAALIEREKVSVNWQTIIKSSKLVGQGDVVTVRGLGRVKVEMEAGKTKKGRVVLGVVKY